MKLTFPVTLSSLSGPRGEGILQSVHFNGSSQYNDVGRDRLLVHLLATAAPDVAFECSFLEANGGGHLVPHHLCRTHAHLADELADWFGGR